MYSFIINTFSFINKLMKLSGDKPLKMSFMLSDNVYAKASIAPDCDKICLWLGVSFIYIHISIDEILCP